MVARFGAVRLEGLEMGFLFRSFGLPSTAMAVLAARAREVSSWIVNYLMRECILPVEKGLD